MVVPYREIPDTRQLALPGARKESVNFHMNGQYLANSIQGSLISISGTAGSVF